MAGIGDERVVTAVTDGSGDLKLTAWDVMADGKLARPGSATAGAASVLAVAGLGMGSVVVTTSAPAPTSFPAAGPVLK